jgi:hypothetical protein
MATRKPTKPKSSAELKQQLEDAKKRLAALEQRAYMEEIVEMLNATSVVSDIKKIREKLPKDIGAAAILQTLADKADFKRIVVTQIPTPPRKPAAKKSKQ